MASGYALPASTITNSHHGHVHSHSHSPSPSRPSAYSGSTTRSLKPERSNGSLHTHSQSDPQLSHIHEHSHHHTEDRDASPYPPSPYKGTAPSPIPESFEEAYEAAPIASYQPVANFSVEIHGDEDHDTHSHDHGHHDHDHHNHDHHDHAHKHDHSHTPVKDPGPRSRFTALILPYTIPWPLLHGILSEKDSRRIFYFMSLNFAFMVVQATYGYLTDSLGLLSDSVHMFFDCLALAVGLFAAMASKWPASERFPYGFGKIESLSGFGNAVFLMLISIEIMTEATERLAEGRETKRLLELFIVSTLGLAVNLVGMMAFGHSHAGHDHGSHSHGHSHSHAHSPAELHSHDNGHQHGHGCDHDHNHTPLLSEKPSPAVHSHAGHSHSHDNENMLGIYLHILADTMGSAAVVVSTTLIHFTGWSGWDPLASCIIAVLIFASSGPLFKSSAMKLLLTVPDNTEYSLREALGGVAELRGVASYTVPRFWLGDNNSESEQILGVIHVSATRGSDLEDVKERTKAFLLERGMDVVVQVEKDGDTSCWCGGSSTKSSPPSSRFS